MGAVRGHRLGGAVADDPLHAAKGIEQALGVALEFHGVQCSQ